MEMMMGASEQRRRNQSKRKKKKKLVVGEHGLTTTPASTGSASASASASTAATPAVGQEAKGSSGSSKASSSKKQRGKPKQLLSFNEEEEADTHFVIKKDRRRRKTADVPLDQPISAAKPAFSSTYTPDDLKKLRANQSFTPGSFREQGSLDESVGVPGDDDSEERGADGSFIQSAPLSGTGLDASMPPEDVAKFARQRRQMLRDQQEYIPLDDDHHDASAVERRVRPAQQRLVRDDDDDDDDDGGDAVAGGRRSHALSFDAAARRISKQDKLKQMHRAFFEAETSEADEEVQRWEQDALKRAATVNVVSGVDRRGQARTAATSRLHQHGYYVGMDPGAAIPTDTARPDVSVEALHKKLKETLVRSREMATAHRQHASRIDADLTDLKKRLPNEEASLQAACERYNFLKETKIYVKNLVECLDVKAREIEQLESEVHAHFKSVSDRLKHRRQQDLTDRRDAILHNVLRLPDEQQQRISRRRARIAAAVRAGKVDSKEEADTQAWSDVDDDDDDGGGSDGSDGGVAKQEEEHRTALFQKASALLQDVNEDFADIPKIADRFETWKLRQPDSYADAFVSMTLKNILQPLISLQLIPWNPLDRRSADFESLPWFNDLMLYGCDKETHAQDENDPDAYLVPELIDLILVPKTAGFLEFVYDPLSSTQTDAAVANVRRMQTDFHIDFSSENGQKLVTGLTAALRRAASGLPPVFVPPPNTLASNDTKPFQQATIAHTTKFIRNALAWRSVVPEEVLHDIILVSIISKSVLHTMNTCGDADLSVYLLLQIVQCLPSDWFSAENNPHRDAIRQKLEPFTAFLTQYARKLPQQQQVGTVIGALSSFGESKKAAKLHGYLASMG
ncbi:hypothetical protein PTSG_03717 [Salpingoeca rosetta]|uniref:GCF C-terminal domain-containing protein n=1 Tax=Salpingoeca rosetta (strain ATCC 50818 / BSB-021) TaxID=946362 RepID=F2U6D8_SALR5|nr:uncharacterized protein PTSG_03717 [Salpingoeca rosetta]EGD83079.1 hypothetical protein PTSG_03717 [Salpingoeca rosetta]|eukprot:XP_004995443.1 hypothetical protein PTSG_03717 [Salpingoeca rosetta]